MNIEIKKPKIIIEAVVTRKDGTIEDLGEIYNNLKETKNIKEVDNNGRCINDSK